GIGANSAIFSLVNSFLLRPLPVPHPEQIAYLTFETKEGTLQNNFSVPEYQDIQRGAGAAFSDIFGYQVDTGGLTIGKETAPVTTNYVTGNFFGALGLQPELGRFISEPEGNVAEISPVIVLGYTCWKTRFGGDPNVVGRSVLYDGRPVTVIGVVKREFHGPYALLDTQVYLPMGMILANSTTARDYMTNRDSRYVVLYGRLRPGVDVAGSQPVLRVLSERMAREYPKSETGIVVEAFPERLSRPYPDRDNTMLKIATLFLIMAALVLVLACVNVANFLLVRATVRQQEMAIRSALGGSRSRLIRQLLTESVVLGLCGGLAGIFVGMVVTDLLSSIKLHTSFSVVLDFQFDWLVFLYASGVALATGLLVGLVPAWRASNGQMLQVMRDGGRTATASRSWLRNGLVVAQVGGSLMLLIVAGLMTRSLENVRQMQLGFKAPGVLDFTMDPMEIGYDQQRGLEFYKAVVERVRSIPGVKTASVAFSAPLGYYQNGDSIEVPGVEVPKGEALPGIGLNQVLPEYFVTMGIPLIDGRDFTNADTTDKQHVAIVNHAMAERFWPKQSAIGHEFTMVSDRTHPVRVVGVAENSRTTSLLGEMRPYAYVPLAQSYSSLATLQVRVENIDAPERMINAVREQIAGVAPTMPVFDVRPLEQAMDTLNGFLVFEMAAVLAGALGGLGLILAVVGVFGVISFTVSQRTHEIGIRMALGAKARDVLAMVLRQGAVIVAIGLAFGILLATVMGKLVGAFLSGVSPFDPLTYVGVTVGLTVVAMAACWVPAHRATRVDPMVALRYE
ncbi:MAG: ABC transporter permease, partial [Acidobacteria bacterium]|nr:ABC transporter permease [Acidobacteriota bacterium]